MAPSASPQVDSTTNRARMIGDNGFDANGNWLGAGLVNQTNTWNVENQLVSNGTVDGNGNLLTYTYDPWGKRVLQYSVSCTNGPSGTLYFYSITGQRLGAYQVSYLNSNNPPLPQSTPLYFGGRLLAPVDRLGSVRQNQERTNRLLPVGRRADGANGTTPDGTDKFATYFRDVTNNGVGEDYANARYYNNNFGRFWSADPAGQADLTDPQSWNQYAYAGGDPVNRNDPGGLWPCWVGVGESPDRSTSCSVITFVWQAMSTDPGPHGGGASGGLLRPYLSTSKKATADKALKQAETWAEIPKCDHALQAYGISSIEALLQGVVTESNSQRGHFRWH